MSYMAICCHRDRFIIMDVKTAEMTKFVANVMLATKISFINEISNIYEKTGVNIESVRLGIWSDKHMGYKFIYVVVDMVEVVFQKM